MPSRNNDYRRDLARMMSYLDGVEYPWKTTVFSEARLLQITPEHVLRWLNFKTFGIPNPLPDMLPCNARSSSILYYKKAVSSFMVHHGYPWHPIENWGNPTRAPQINKLIAYIQSKEVRGQGRPSKARRSLTHEEFMSQQTLLRENPLHGVVVMLGVPACCSFQMHLLARVDDVTQWRKEFFKSHTRFPTFAARCRLAWSKNVRQEGDAPWQIMLGSLDPLFCVFVGLAIWLEYYNSGTHRNASPYMFDFSSDNRIPEGGEKSCSFVQRTLAKLYHGTGTVFEPDSDANDVLLGSHSIRKYASSRCRNAGASKDDKDYRGRFKCARRVSDRYDDNQLPYVDAHVAGKLCPGEPCSYNIRESSPVTEDWILEYVVPNLNASSHGPTLSKLLGKALLWTIFSDKRHWVPDTIVERVMLAYDVLLNAQDQEVQLQEANNNPIFKKMLLITGSDAVLHITEVNDQEPPAGQGGAAAGVGAAAGGGALSNQTGMQLMHLLLQQQTAMQATIASLVQQRDADRLNFNNQLRVVNSNIKRVGQQPTRMLQRAEDRQRAAQRDAAGGAAVPAPRAHALRPAELSPLPKDLYVLWDEYMDGIAGRKPAKDFTTQERGAVRHMYCRRKIIWDLVSLLINAGRTAQVAIDTIYAVYGEGTNVTAIINGIKNDRKNRTMHPNLRF
jgi:hypothetical protein